MKHLIETDGSKSGTKTLLVIAAAIVFVKYILSEVSFGSFSFGTFDAAGAAVILGLPSTLYFGRHNIKIGKGE